MTGMGSVILLFTGIGHTTGIVRVEKMMVESGMKAPLDVLLKVCWLTFGGEQLALAVIAMVASAMAGGGRIVLICAATMFVNATLLLHFLGPFVGVYLSVVVALLFLAGGWMQAKEAA